MCCCFGCEKMCIRRELRRSRGGRCHHQWASFSRVLSSSAPTAAPAPAASPHLQPQQQPAVSTSRAVRRRPLSVPPACATHSQPHRHPPSHLSTRTPRLILLPGTSMLPRLSACWHAHATLQRAHHTLPFLRRSSTLRAPHHPHTRASSLASVRLSLLPSPAFPRLPSSHPSPATRRSQSTSPPPSAAQSELPSVSVEEAAGDLKRFEYVIDCREDDEVKHGMIDGAYHIPLGQLVRDMSKPLVQKLKGKPVLVYCRSGKRSGMAVASQRRTAYHTASHRSTTPHTTLLTLRCRCVVLCCGVCCSAEPGRLRRHQPGRRLRGLAEQQRSSRRQQRKGTRQRPGVDEWTRQGWNGLHFPPLTAAAAVVFTVCRPRPPSPPPPSSPPPSAASSPSSPRP